MIDFEQKKTKNSAKSGVKYTDKQLDAIRKRGRLAPSSLTSQELLALAEQNDRIEGTHINEANLERYNRLLALLNEAMSLTGAIGIVADKPDRHKPCCDVFFCVGDPFGASSQKMVPLLRAAAIADEFTFATDDDNKDILQLCYTIYDIWEE